MREAACLSATHNYTSLLAALSNRYSFAIAVAIATLRGLDIRHSNIDLFNLLF